jgi:hypothetical protein
MVGKNYHGIRKIWRGPYNLNASVGNRSHTTPLTRRAPKLLSPIIIWSWTLYHALISHKLGDTDSHSLHFMKSQHVYSSHRIKSAIKMFNIPNSLISVIFFRPCFSPFHSYNYYYSWKCVTFFPKYHTVIFRASAHWERSRATLARIRGRYCLKIQTFENHRDLSHWSRAT